MAVLELVNVHRAFGGVRAIDGVDLALEAGELRVLVGPNGCGKSTLFNLISGALRPSQGRIRFDGHDVTGVAPHRMARRGVGRKFQPTAVFDDLSLEQNVAVAQWRGRTGPTIDTLLRRIRLLEKRRVLASALSHGERQWLEIGMVLAQAPRLLLLDEPTAGMTVPEAQAMVDLIHDIAAPGDVTVFVIEHDVAFLERLDCLVTVMAKGRVLRTASFEEVRADPAVRALYFGTGAAA